MRREEPLAIVAGSGALPALLAQAAQETGHPVVIVDLDGEADAGFGRCEVHTLRYGEVGRFLKLLEARDCRTLVMAGGITRPSIAAIRPDWGAVKLMPRVARILMGGDDSLLRGVANLLDEHGLRLVSPLDVAPHLAAPGGLIAGPEPSARLLADIDVGRRTALALGDTDAGQAVIVDAGRAIALEGLEGTDAMIARAGALRTDGRWRSPPRSGVLVKAAKPSQDMRLDVPTIGPDTVLAAHAAGLAGIAVQAGRVLLVERDRLEGLAAERGVFVWGVS